MKIYDYLVFTITLSALIISGCDRAENEDGMIYIAEGKTKVTNNSRQFSPSQQTTADVDAFLLDKHPVTVKDFRLFVEKTGYITEAVKMGNSIIFDFEDQEWSLKDGSTWRYPLGEDAGSADEDHPVTHVTYADARAYLKWAGKRLPTATEWEHAARLARNADIKFTWGQSLVDSSGYRANTWTGTFPSQNTGDDGFHLTSPVGYFGPNELGLTDMGGNVWEWTSTENERGEMTLKGGSFMCHASYCEGYKITGKTFTSTESSFFHAGFRGAKDL